MNVFNKLLLNMVLWPKFLYEKVGANPRHLRLILSAKLTMDDRRPNTFHQTRKKVNKQISAATLGTMFFSFLFGLFFLYAFIVIQDRITQFTVYFSLYICMLSITLISDFTSVLIDVRDNFIILTKPVTDKTFVISRLLHIFIHVLKIVLPMILPALGFVFFFIDAWGAFLMCFLVLLATVFSIFIINAIYLVVLKFSTPVKFQNVISYIQIIVAVVLYGSYQIVPRFTERIRFSDYSLGDKSWAWLLPSYWFAAGWQFFHSFEMRYIAGGILSLIVPPLTLWIVIKYFAPSFNQKLSQITGASEEAVTPGSKQTLSFWTRLSQRLAVLCTKPGEERMGFLLTWKLTSRSREFKLKVYPSIGYLLVYILVMALNRHVSIEDLREQTTNSRWTVIGVIYISVLVISLALNQIQYSDKFKAAWIYFTTPVKAPGNILTGSFKATIIKFLLPVAVVFLAAGISLIGIQVLPNLIFGLCNVVLSSLLIALLTVTTLPFSKQQTNTNRTGTFIRGLMSMIVPLFFGLLQFFLYYSVWGLLLCTCLSVIASWLLIDHIRNRSWKKLVMAYED